MWFAAHIVTAHVHADGEEEQVVVEEAIVLLDAEDFESARVQAEAMAEERASETTSYLHPRSAHLKNLGVKRIIMTSNPELGNETPPVHGTEITYTLLEFANMKLAKLFADDISVCGKYWVPRSLRPSE